MESGTVYRNLQKISGSFFVSLPKKWVENYKLHSKSPISIEIRSNGALLISPKLEGTDDHDLKNEIVLDATPYVVRAIIKNSLSGQMNVVVHSDKKIEKKLRNEIRRFVSGLPNTEITEEQPQLIVIQNFGYKKIPTRNLIQRLLYLIEDMFVDVKENARDDLQYNFEQLRTFYFILVTHIRTYLKTNIYVTEDNDFTPLEAMDYRMFCEKIEEVGKILRVLHLGENVLDFYEKMFQYFKEVMKAYMEDSQELAHYAWLKKDKLEKEALELMDGLDWEDKDRIKDMIYMAHLIKDMAAVI